MSDPIIKFGMHNAVSELISACSSLNMEPRPIASEDLKEDQTYLSQTDVWCKHSYEHMEAAIRSLDLNYNYSIHERVRKYIMLSAKIMNSDDSDSLKKMKIKRIVNRIIDLFLYGKKGRW